METAFFDRHRSPRRNRRRRLSRMARQRAESGLRQFDPDLLCYIAGADPYREDQLGGLSLTIDGLKKRDELVFHVARAARHPRDGDLCRRLRAECRRYGHNSLQHGDCRERSVHAVKTDIAETDKVLRYTRPHGRYSFANLTHRELYNILISAVVPRPIAWVSSLSASGRPNLAPFSFFNAVCAKPPLLAFAPGMRLPHKSEALARRDRRSILEYKLKTRYEIFAKPKNS